MSSTFNCIKYKKTKIRHLFLHSRESNQLACMQSTERILNHLHKCISLQQFKQLHAQAIITSVFQRDFNYVSVKFISFLSNSLHDISYAKTIFCSFVSRANVFLWTSMICCYANHKPHLTKEGFEVFRMMFGNGPRPNCYTVSSVMKVCSVSKAVREGKQVHGFVEKSGFGGSLYVNGAMVDMYGKFGLVENARKVYENMYERNVVVCNAMLDSYVKSGDVKSAQEVFDKMSHRDVVSWNSLIYGYAIVGNMSISRGLFDKMTDKNVNSWNIIIFGYSRNGQWKKAIETFNDMLICNVKPDSATIAIILSACSHLGCLKIAQQIHGLLCKSSIKMNCHAHNSILDTYAKCGGISDACKMFEKLRVKDLVSYNVMIGAFANHGFGKEAIKLFDEMNKNGLKPDKITFLALLTACSHAGLIESGKNYFDSMTRYFAIKPSVDHYASMVDLFGRAGLINTAFEFTQNMPVKPNAGVWGALLNACVKHNNAKIGKIAAKELLEIEPDNPGNYVILSNICARDKLWDDVAGVRGLMKGNKVGKTKGCSWIQVGFEVREFMMGDLEGFYVGEIYDALRHLSLQLMTNE